MPWVLIKHNKIFLIMITNVLMKATLKPVNGIFLKMKKIGKWFIQRLSMYQICIMLLIMVTIYHVCSTILLMYVINGCVIHS
jgi:hypothetical protein